MAADGGTSYGGVLSTGGAGMGGAAMGGAGTGGSAPCDPALQCRGHRAYYLIFSAYGRRPIRPEVARCVDYNDDEWLDVFDYLTLTETWGENCPEGGELSEPGVCLFPGDIDGNGCLDLVGDYKGIERQVGQLASESSNCADTNDDGWVDEVDLAYVASRISMLGCEGLDLDPEHLIDGDLGVAKACGDAPIGDVNEDGAINYRDLYAILGHLGLDVTAPAECIDLNRDQTIDLADLLHYFERGPGFEIDGCPGALTELESFVDENKSCTTDSDCSSFTAGCSHVAEHCSRVVYLNSATDETELDELVEASSECMWTSGCRSCSSTPPTPRCQGGRCSPGGD